MSLVTTPTLRILYDRANASGTQEHETTTFWVHLFSKVYFNEENYVTAPEKPPSNAVAVPPYYEPGHCLTMAITCSTEAHR